MRFPIFHSRSLSSLISPFPLTKNSNSNFNSSIFLRFLLLYLHVMLESSRFLPRSSTFSFRPGSRRLLDSIPALHSCRRRVLALIWAVGFILIISWQKAAIHSFWGPPARPIPRLRSIVFNLTDFGAVGDGVTLNTKAFERAIWEIRRRGGGQLNVEPGRWLTAPFNLTSHMTLFLAQNAVILGIDVSALLFFCSLS